MTSTFSFLASFDHVLIQIFVQFSPSMLITVPHTCKGYNLGAIYVPKLISTGGELL